MPGPRAPRAHLDDAAGGSNGSSVHPAISARGQSVFFDTDATNLKIFPFMQDDTNGVRDMYAGIVGHGSAGVESLDSENHLVPSPSVNPFRARATTT